MQGEYIKYYCFLCIWDSCATADHYIKHYWNQRIFYEPDKQCAKINSVTSTTYKPGFNKTFCESHGQNQL